MAADKEAISLTRADCLFAVCFAEPEKLSLPVNISL